MGFGQLRRVTSADDISLKVHQGISIRLARPWKPQLGARKRRGPRERATARGMSTGGSEQRLKGAGSDRGAQSAGEACDCGPGVLVSDRRERTRSSEIGDFRDAANASRSPAARGNVVPSADSKGEAVRHRPDDARTRPRGARKRAWFERVVGVSRHLENRHWRFPATASPGGTNGRGLRGRSRRRPLLSPTIPLG